jgi:L-cysteine/cystine lyase
MGRVLAGLDFAPGDEVLTAELEHPGLHGPLIAARERFGIAVREVPIERIAEAVGPQTRLIACSHVTWTGGSYAPTLLGVPDDVPVLLDGAQGVGAVPVDVTALGCAFYAGAGQKWLCGPVGAGMLWVSPAWRERLAPTAPVYANLEDPGAGLSGRIWPDARAHDAGSIPLESTEAAMAAHDTLAAFGWEQVHERAATLAARLGDMLRDAGREVAPRDATTLVSWRSDDPEAEALRLRERGVIVRHFPGLPFVRASVGAWNDESDLERLVSA